MASSLLDIDKLSDETFDFLCTMCKHDGKNTEAVKYCTDCCDYYCVRCIKVHNTVPALKQHKIVDQGQFKKGSGKQLPMIPTERCERHGLKPVDMYCENHDTVGCPSCMTVDHRLCQGIFYIPEYVQTIASKVNPQDLQRKLDATKKMLSDEIRQFEEEKQEAIEKQAWSIQQIRNFRKEINGWLDKLEKVSKVQIENEYKKMIRKIEKAMCLIKESKTDVTLAQDKLMSAGNNVSQAFVSTKIGHTKAMNAEKCLAENKAGHKKRQFDFARDPKLSMLLKELKALGHIVQKHVQEHIIMTDVGHTEQEQIQKQIFNAEVGHNVQEHVQEHIPNVKVGHNVQEHIQEHIPNVKVGHNVQEHIQEHIPSEKVGHNVQEHIQEHISNVKVGHNLQEHIQEHIPNVKVGHNVQEHIQEHIPNVKVGHNVQEHIINAEVGHNEKKHVINAEVGHNVQEHILEHISKTQHGHTVQEHAINAEVGNCVQEHLKMHITETEEKDTDIDKEHSKLLQIKGKKTYSITGPSDKQICNVFSSCVLGDGTFLLADFVNKRLLRLDKSRYRVRDQFHLPVWPWQVCTINNWEVVVSYQRNEIMFISVGYKMRKKSIIKTEFQCYALAFAHGNLYISDGSSSVYICSVSGQRLKTFSKDSSGKPLFSSSYGLPIQSLSVSRDGSLIYVAGYEKGLIVLDNNGKVLTQVSGPELEFATDVHVTSSGNVLVVGSKNVLQFKQTGELIGKVVWLDRGASPQTVCCDKQMSKMIVGRENTNVIEVYDLA